MDFILSLEPPPLPPTDGYEAPPLHALIGVCVRLRLPAFVYTGVPRYRSELVCFRAGAGDVSMCLGGRRGRICGRSQLFSVWSQGPLCGRARARRVTWPPLCP